jgi:retinol dehydrogenase 14
MGETVLITGATGALGGATAKELAKNNWQLILLGRNYEKLTVVKSEITEATGNKDIDIFSAELSEPASIRQAAAEIKKKYSYLNVLINVAGIFKKDHLENSAGLEYMFATNHLGPFVLTGELLELLKSGKPSRVITVSAPSTTKINFDDINGNKKFSAGFLGAFGASKMMNLMFAYALARRLEGSGMTSNLFHPGLVKSNLTIEMPAFLNFIIQSFAKKPEIAAKTLCSLAIDKKYESSNGTFMTLGGKEIKSNEYTKNKELQEKLWTISEQLTK